MYSSIRRFLCVMLWIFLLTPASVFAQEDLNADYHPGRILVKFKKSPAMQEVRAFAAANQLKLEKVIPKVDAFLLSIPQNQQVAQVVERLNRLGIIEYAEPDFVRKAYYEPLDPLFDQQYDMILMGLPAWWDFDKGNSSVTVAVLDTGIDLDHPDLISRLWQNTDETPANGIDDDGNGYVDDYNGYDFAGDGLFPPVGAEDPIPEDTYVGHGTHVSGTIAATQDNGIGISGEAPGVKVMPVRVLGGIIGMGYSSDLAEGIVYAADNGANVINMSLGGTAKSLTEYNALKYAWNHNVFTAAAAGNDGNGANPISYPAGYVFTMSVGATDSADNIAYFSTHNEFVEISAPGVTILSTVPGGIYESDIWSGTSMATPHVAGLAALLYSMYTGIDNWQVRSMLQQGVVDRGAAGWDEYFGYGRADCVALLATPTPSPDVLTLLTPPNGITYRSGALIAFLWNPVPGAVRYRITATLPNLSKKIIFTTATYYTVSPSPSLPAGTYTVSVDALASNGTILSYDTVSFSK